MPTKERMLITGGNPLEGEVRVSGGKNTAVAVIPATLLCDEPCTIENLPDIEKFAFVHPKDMAKVRKVLKDDLKFVEKFATQGYVGHVAGIALFTKADAIENTIVVANREAVTLFNKRGIEIEQERDADIRKNLIFSRKYYLAALTDATKAVKITIG